MPDTARDPVCPDRPPRSPQTGQTPRTWSDPYRTQDL